MITPDKNNLPEGVYYDEDDGWVYLEGMCCSWSFYVAMLNHPKVQEKYYEKTG